MITDQNTQAVIEAYLAGRLDEAGRQEVEEKIADDLEFRNEVQHQQALLLHLDDEWRKETYTLIDQLLAEEIVVDKSDDDDRNDTVPVYPISFWQQRWVRLAAMIFIVSGLIGVSSYVLFTPTETPITLTYYQRNLGMADPNANEERTTLPVAVITQLWSTNEYETGRQGVRLYLRHLPDDIARWAVRDDPETGGYLLQTPSGTVYKLDRDTQGVRKPLETP